MNNDEAEKLKKVLEQLANGVCPEVLPADLPFYAEINKIASTYKHINEFSDSITKGVIISDLPPENDVLKELNKVKKVLDDLTEHVLDLTSGDYSLRIEGTSQLADTFNSLAEQLEYVFHQYQDKTTELDAVQTNFDNDMKLAQEAQIKMMKEVPESPFSLSSRYLAPLQRVSGDFYHEFIDNNGDLNIFAGDATGHGIVAGLVTMMTRTAFESIENDVEPDKVLTRVNDLLYNCLPEDMYITGTLVRLAPDGKAKIAMAGHFPVVIYRKDKKICELSERGGMPLGMFPSEIAEFSLYNCVLNPGDRMFFFTDGIIECRNNEIQLGMDKFLEILLKHQDNTIQNMVGEAIGDVWDYVAETGFEDDVLLVAHEYTENPKR